MFPQQIKREIYVYARCFENPKRRPMKVLVVPCDVVAIAALICEYIMGLFIESKHATERGLLVCTKIICVY